MPGNDYWCKSSCYGGMEATNWSRMLKYLQFQGTKKKYKSKF